MNKLSITIPKLLPWLAKKAGIPLPRAEVLWHAAQRHAAHAHRRNGYPRLLVAAMDHLLELVAAERLREDAASFGWRRWTRLYNRSGRHAAGRARYADAEQRARLAFCEASPARLKQRREGARV